MVIKQIRIPNIAMFFYEFSMLLFGSKKTIDHRPMTILAVKTLDPRLFLSVHAEKFHFFFFASKRDGIQPFPLEVICLVEVVHEGAGNETVALIRVAFFLDS